MYRAVGELAAALQGPSEDFETKYGFSQPAKDAQLVFSCRSGNRSRRAMDAALELGFQK